MSALELTFAPPEVADAFWQSAGKSFLVLTAVFLAAWLCRRSAAATRHFLWLAGLASLLVLPAAILLSPRWNGPAWVDGVFRQHRTMSEGNSIPDLLTGRAVASDVKTPLATTPRALSTSLVEPIAKSFAWRSVLLPGWASGVVLTLLVFLQRRWQLWKIECSSRPVIDAAVLGLWERVLSELGLRRKVRLLETGQSLMPMTWGYWRPVALLPADAAKWERERLRLVLRHELAHVRRKDCLTQALAAVVCAFYWFNPLVWLAAAQMRVERERACDDLVVALGKTRPSEYAGHLLEIAREMSAAPLLALPVAKKSGLERRLRALLDGANHHAELTRGTAVSVACVLAVCLIGLAGWRVAAAETEPEQLRQQLIARLKTFSTLKAKQSEELAAAAGEKISPEFQDFFDAAIRGDGRYVTNKYVYYKQNHPQYAHTNAPVENLRTSYWSPVLEICLAYYDVVADDPKYVQEFADDIIQSIPAGSIYFGGTDPGRGLVTAFCTSQPDADPFFTLTQNALADPTYLEYLGRMYGGRIFVPTKQDSAAIYQDFYAGLEKRLAENKLKPGEQAVKDASGNLQVSGQVALMEINAAIAKMIFDRNPGREFYIEECFPLDWMYSYLEPHGLILKIDRTEQTEMSAETVQRDEDYWQPRVDEMIGGWLHADTPLQTVLDFADKTYGRKDLSGFTGNLRFVQDSDSQKMFSKLRCAIAGVYAWRASQAGSDRQRMSDDADLAFRTLNAVPASDKYLSQSSAERQRMSDAADLAFREAFALCPYAPDTIHRYTQFLVAQDRKVDAIALLETSLREPRLFDPNDSRQISDALASLKAQKMP